MNLNDTDIFNQEQQLSELLFLFPDGNGLDGHDNYQRIIQKISDIVNDLIQTDLNRLLNILYRLDIDENKLRKALAVKDTGERTATSGDIIARLIAERQLQKIITRREYRHRQDTL